MAMFVVEPGVSFHSVQEVLAPAKWRISIQGWYHAAEAPPDTHFASIRQLTTRAAELADVHKPPFVQIDLSRDDEVGAGNTADAVDVNETDSGGEEPFEPLDLSPADMEFLGRWINAAYLTESQIDVIADKMADQVRAMHFWHSLNGLELLLNFSFFLSFIFYFFYLLLFCMSFFTGFRTTDEFLAARAC